MYNHILVPVDPGHGRVGARIIAVAKLLAGGQGRVTLLTVVEPVPSHIAIHLPEELLEKTRREARDALEALAGETGIDPAAVILREGGPGNTILAVAEELGVDAVILGSHRPGFGDFLLGSTAARVVRHAQCTVVVERSDPH